MLPLEIDQLILAMKKIEPLWRKGTWQDESWRQDLATAVEELNQAGQKLAKSSQAGFDTVGQIAEKAAQRFQEALRLWANPIERIGPAFTAGLYTTQAANLAHGLVLKNELETLGVNYYQN